MTSEDEPGRVIEFELEEELRERLENIALEEDVTVEEILLRAVKQYLRRYGVIT